uniref:Cytochrome P450 n=1 Tax=Strigamia maritima TaxID=126957 RepID=T1IT96_STRMM
MSKVRGFRLHLTLWGPKFTFISTDLESMSIVLPLVSLILWVTLTYINSHKNLPPGPKGIPFLGYLPFLGRKPHLVLTELKKKYGDILTIHIGSERVVVLSSFELIKEAMLKDDNYEERPASFCALVAAYESQGGLFGNCANKVQRILFRNFTKTTLRNFGMGKASLEPKIQDEISYLVNAIKMSNGKPAYLQNMIKTTITNIICTIMYGERMDYNNKDFQQLIQLSGEYFRSLGINEWSQYLPQFLANMFGIATPIDKMRLLYKKILNEVQKYDTINEGINKQQSFIDVWRSEAMRPNSNPVDFEEEKLTQVLSELFIAGSDTTSVMLEWALLYLIKYPIVQAKMQMEIDEVIGKDKAPSMTDQKFMPYTQATILELNRIISIAPLASKDSSLAGYHIPKNTTIYANSWAVHHDPEIFPEPESVKPERFLTENNEVKHVKELIPFGMGKRQCIGEAMAKTQLFLYLTTLLQQFTFTAENVSVNSHFSILLQPVPQKICAALRR